MKSILTEQQVALSIKRLAHQILENHLHLENTVLIGIQPRGIYVSDRIVNELKNIQTISKIDYGKLDITFYRDDFRKKELVPSSTEINFDIENKNVVLVDDVLYTGRTIRAALDAMLTLGRPKDVELVTLIDRRLSRNVPIQAKYIGKTIDSIASEKVLVHWKETDNKDEVLLLTEKTEKQI